MINTLDEYIGHSLPDDGCLVTAPGLRRKVDAEGGFLPFAGNTVVFTLDDGVKQQLERLREELYSAAGFMLSRRLESGTFHMTLHDLANGTPDEPGLEERMADARAKAIVLLKQWTDMPPLRMRATWMFNMVSTSIVLGLSPADEDSRTRLGGMYRALEEVVTLGYALTPHITLAYFRPGEYRQEQVQCLRSALRPVELDLTLRAEQLEFQNFTDMNHYTKGE